MTQYPFASLRGFPTSQSSEPGTMQTPATPRPVLVSITRPLILVNPGAALAAGATVGAGVGADVATPGPLPDPLPVPEPVPLPPAPPPAPPPDDPPPAAVDDPARPGAAGAALLSAVAADRVAARSPGGRSNPGNRARDPARATLAISASRSARTRCACRAKRRGEI